MVKIRNERDLNNWFKKNYKKLGFSEMVRHDIGIFPDFIMKDLNGKEVSVELEIKSSNFLMHKHPIDQIDQVICVEKDIDLGIPTRVLENIQIVGYESKTPYSTKSIVEKLFEKEKIWTTSEVASNLEISWNTAESHLKNMLIDSKLERIKKEGTTLWMEK